MAINLSTFGLSSDEADARARLALQAGRRTTSKQKRVTKKGYTQAKGAVTEGYGTARQDLAAPLAAAGRFLEGQQEGYDIGRGSLGLLGDKGVADAEAAYRRSLQPEHDRLTEDLRRERVGGGRLASGGLATDLQELGYSKFFRPWQQDVLGMNPMAANAQVADIGGRLGGYATGQGDALNKLATGQASDLGTIYGAQGQNKQDYLTALNTNAGTVAGNWGTLANGLLTAGTSLAGGPLGSSLFGASKVPKVPARGFGGFGQA